MSQLGNIVYTLVDGYNSSGDFSSDWISLRDYSVVGLSVDTTNAGTDGYLQVDVSMDDSRATDPYWVASGTGGPVPTALITKYSRMSYTKLAASSFGVASTTGPSSVGVKVAGAVGQHYVWQEAGRWLRVVWDGTGAAGTVTVKVTLRNKQLVT